MPVSVNVKADLARLTARLTDVQRRQIPFAASRALNDVALRAKTEITAALPEIFDRPTPFTKSSIAVVLSKKSNLVATVLVKDVQAKYLELEETGGERTPTRTALVAPGKTAPLNAYGNLPRNYLAGLRSKAEADIERRKAAKAARAAKGRRRAAARTRDKGILYFAGKGPRGRGPGGYFVRGPGHTLRRLTGFETVERYRPRFGFRTRVERTARASFAAALEQRLAEAGSAP